MVKINLLPHREQKRKKIHRVFYVKLGMVALTGAALVVVGALLLEVAIEHQQNINQMIADENKQLDSQVKEVATLKQEIDALKARQQAVENLQNDRNQSIFLMEDLARQVPEGIYLYAVTQEEKTVTVSGFAQTNEHVSEFMRNIDNNAKWTANPQLQEIRSTYRQRTNNANHVFDFTMTITLNTLSTRQDKDDGDEDTEDDDDSNGDLDTDDDDNADEDASNDKADPPPKTENNTAAPAATDNNSKPTKAEDTPQATTPTVAPGNTPSPAPAAPESDAEAAPVTPPQP